MFDLQRKFEKIIRKWSRANIGTPKKGNSYWSYEMSFAQHLRVVHGQGKYRMQKSIYYSSPFLRHRARYSWFCFSPCLLTRLSESSDSWPRNKSKTVLFLNGSGWKLVTKSGTTLREDTGGERSWVCKDSRNGKTEGLYWIVVIDQSYQMEFNIFNLEICLCLKIGYLSSNKT